jgi:hypothetical protein
MVHTASSRGFLRILAAAAVLSVATPAAAQRQPAPSPVPPQNTVAVPRTVVDGDQDARATRDRLLELLQTYPPTLGLVLRMDPSLLNSPNYLATYPALAAFLAQHPDVAHNPDFFLERMRVDRPGYDDPRYRARQEFYNLLGGVAAFSAFLVVTAVIVWIIRLIVQQRRWNRMSKVQFDTHAKLLDRFTSNEDLLAYVQTPAGRRFLEATPIPMEDQPRAIAAPLSRILWSVQAGVVLAVAGLGLLYVSSRFTEEPAEFFMVIGVITIALGVGFMMSAVAAYALSRRLGLMEPAQPSTNA